MAQRPIASDMCMLNDDDTPAPMKCLGDIEGEEALPHCLDGREVDIRKKRQGERRTESNKSNGREKERVWHGQLREALAVPLHHRPRTVTSPGTGSGISPFVWIALLCVQWRGKRGRHRNSECRLLLLVVRGKNISGDRRWVLMRQAIKN